MKPEVEISIGCPEWKSLPDFSDSIYGAIAAAFENCGKRLAGNTEVSLLLCDDETIRSINKKWRGIDKATNVLSFPSPGKLDQKPMLGDIAIAFETTRAEALAEGKTINAHFSHLLVHGFLHLVGFDHETETEADEMEAMERLILSKLGVADPYLGSVLAEDQSSQ